MKDVIAGSENGTVDRRMVFDLRVACRRLRRLGWESMIPLLTWMNENVAVGVSNVWKTPYIDRVCCLAKKVCNRGNAVWEAR